MIKSKILEIDGSFGEGGGSILRLSAAFSILYNLPIKIKNIRANRSQPGLRLQHVLGLKTLSDITGSNLSNCDVGTKVITLFPNNDNLKDESELNVDTAASIGLLLQPIQIACLKYNQPKKISITINGGGTFGEWAPSLSYLSNVTYPIYQHSGLRIDLKVIKHGFYPKGGAKVHCSIHLPNKNLKPVVLTKMGKIENIQGEIIITMQLKKGRTDIGNRIQKVINREISDKLGLESNITIQYVNSLSPGVGVCLWAYSDTGAIISTGTILGERKITSENLGHKAAQIIINYIENEIPVDNYLSDQLIPLMAYVDMPSKIRVLEITNHTKTNLDLIQLFSNRKYNITENQNSFIIEYES
jgi:RNA 3'-phosphate cyclase